MPSRRDALALLGSTATTAFSGCLAGIGDGDDDAGTPTPVVDRFVDGTGSIPQYQVDAGNAGRLDDGAQPIVDGTDVYVAFDGTLVNLALDDGGVSWTADVGHASESAPAVHDGVVYATVWNGGESTPRGLVAVDDRVQHSVAVDGESVVVAHHGGVTALALGGGERQWWTEIDRTSTAPMSVDGTILVGSGREVVALSSVEGTERWRVETRERNYTDVVLRGVTGSPVATAGGVLVSTQAGDVYAFDDG